MRSTTRLRSRNHELSSIAIIGVGLVGGSVALAAKALDGRVRVVGVGRRRESLDAALRIGAIDAAFLEPNIAKALPGADLVILATPVGAFERYLRAIKPHLSPGAVVTDVGSTKAQVVAAARRILGPKAAFVGSHPMAGGEQKGPAHARADLLTGATCVLTSTPATPRAALVRVERFWRALGMRTVRMSAAAHDRAVAAVSHLPHLLACLLMLLPKRGQLSVAASGLRDMTRLAGGDPEMWRDIMLSNRREILRAMNALIRRQAVLRKAIAGKAAGRIQQFLAAAQKRRTQVFPSNNG